MRQVVANSIDTFYATKRLIARQFAEKEVQADPVLIAYEIVNAANGDAWISIRGTKMAPPQVSAEILRKIEEAAEDYLGEPVTEAVITVPVYFNDARREASSLSCWTLARACARPAKFSPPSRSISSCPDAIAWPLTTATRCTQSEP